MRTEAQPPTSPDGLSAPVDTGDAALTDLLDDLREQVAALRAHYETLAAGLEELASAGDAGTAAAPSNGARPRRSIGRPGRRSVFRRPPA